MKIQRGIACLFFITGMVACSPFSAHYSLVDQSLAAHDQIGADAIIQKEEGRYGKNNRLLYLMDRGMTLSLSGRHKESNAMLEQANRVADGLYTESLTKHGLSLLTSDTALPYTGEDFEQVMIHLIMALNYAQLGEIDEALVECRRLDTTLNRINDADQDKKNGYKEDAFARYFSGILYEARGGREGLNNAFISYRKGYEIYQDWEKTYGTPIPAMIAADLLRTSEALQMREEHEAYQKLFPTTRWSRIADQKSKAEVIVISMNGKSPYKENVYLDLVVNQNAVNTILATSHWEANVGSGEAVFSTLGQMVRVAFPRYVPQKSNTRHLLISLSGLKPFYGQSFLVHDITAIAKRSLDDRIVRISARAIARAALKAAAVRKASKKADSEISGGGGILLGKIAEAAVALTESADNRSWRTLPDQIHLSRMVVPPGTYKVSGQFIGQSGNKTIDTLLPREVTLKAGEKRFIVTRTVY
ncbi:MAG: hypothetical protein AAB035_02260 [Nitrospirota bacterium]